MGSRVLKRAPRALNRTIRTIGWSTPNVADNRTSFWLREWVRKVLLIGRPR